MTSPNDASNDAYNEGQALRSLRKGARVSLQTLADTAGCSPSYLSRFENGHEHPTEAWKRKVLAALLASMRAAA